MVEAGFIALTGAVIGLGGAKLLYKAQQLQRRRIPAGLRRDRRARW